MNQPWDVSEAGLHVCSYTPRFSYEGPKLAVAALPTSTAMATAGWVLRAGRVYWVGTWEGYTGVVLPSHRALKGGPTDSEAGPGSPAGAGVGGLWGRNTLRAPEPPTPPLPAVGPAPLGRCLSPGKCRLWANKGENQSIFQ